MFIAVEDVLYQNLKGNSHSCIPTLHQETCRAFKVGNYLCGLV